MAIHHGPDFITASDHDSAISLRRTAEKKTTKAKDEDEREEEEEEEDGGERMRR